MVNTFLTSDPEDFDPETGHKGFRISANNLDKQRLWKQVVEAHQILNLVRSYHVLGEMFKSPCPKDPYLVKAWSKDILQRYKKLDSYVFLHQNKYVWFPKSSPKPKKLKYDEEYSILEDGRILYKGKKYPKYGLILPGDNFITMGFGSHPCVIMWMNHKDSLKLYINTHIEEFLSRGGKPGTKKLMFSLKEDIEHPIWTKDPLFHLNHKAALTTKEIVRSEKEWYISKPDFYIAYRYYIDEPPTKKVKTTSSFEYYMWPFTQDLNDPMY